MSDEQTSASETPSPRPTTDELRPKVERCNNERWMLRLTIVGVLLGAVTAACAIATAWHDLDEMYAKRHAAQEALLSPPAKMNPPRAIAPPVSPQTSPAKSDPPLAGDPPPVAKGPALSPADASGSALAPKKAKPLPDVYYSWDRLEGDTPEEDGFQLEGHPCGPRSQEQPWPCYLPRNQRKRPQNIIRGVE